MYLDIFCDTIESAITYLEPLSIVTYLSMLGKEEREKGEDGCVETVFHVLVCK
jgi:hypothetical protein